MALYRAVFVSFLLATFTLACETSVTSVDSGGHSGGHASEPGDFISDNPNGGYGDEGADDGYGETGDASGGDATGGAPSDDSGGDPGEGEGEREIAEADIVKIEGDRLYALSQYSGLSVIDISAPDELPVLGRFRAQAEPFEMYVENSQAFVMFSNFYSYEWDETAGGYTWYQSSRLIALDATDPQAIEVRGEFDLPGRIQDSRRVGDILYVVTYEDGYCYNCKDTPNTTITSLDVSDEAHPQIVDQLSFEDEPNEWSWGGPRSVSATNERMYVAGTEWQNWDSAHSTIDVIDISDPSGALVAGAKVPVAGQIVSRWQMDEYDGVLRVVSQPGVWNSANPPVIETFAVNSAGDIAALGSTQMVLPRPESLRSVRFDGTRGYAITFEQTDPLFTLDLSDPANPEQVGELEIPGWVYHMEPRGDTILALGFDPTHPEGSVNVSLFDVSTFDAPTMLDRVHFGGDWASFAEDQNRIHKAFTILDDIGLIMVPYSGWEYDSEYGCHGTYRGAIQLIDMAPGDLALRGVADALGRPRRALLHDERLLSVSDKAVESFDISDRSAPVRTAELRIATNVSRVVEAGGHVIRLALDWWSNDTVLEIADPADPENPQPLGRLELGSLGRDQAECWDYGWYDADVFAHGDHVYLIVDSYSYVDGYQQDTRIEVFDVADPAHPAHVRTLALPFARGYYPYLGGLDVTGDPAIQLGDALVLSRMSVDYEGELPLSTAAFEIIDLTNPAEPVHASTVHRPLGLQHGALVVRDGRVLSWHMQAANEDGSKVRFFLEQLDVSTPNNPVASAPVNVPGVLAAYREEQGRLVTVDFQVDYLAIPSEQCWSLANGYYDWNAEVCLIMHRDMKLVELHDDGAVLLDELDLEGPMGSLRGVESSDERLFVHIVHNDPPGNQIVPLADFSAGPLAAGTPVEMGPGWLPMHLAHAEDTRLTLPYGTGLTVVDASDPNAPTLHEHDLQGYSCQDLMVSDDTAYCALGQWGLQVLSLQ